MELILLGLALAQEPVEGTPTVGAETSPPEGHASTTDYTGRIVALRTLAAPRGGLPDEDLEPLLRVTQDRPYSPQDVRQDILMLTRVGEFAQVEVDVEEWPGFAPDGTPIPALRVEYRVFPPPRLGKVTVTGNRALSRREVLAAMGRESGDAWFTGEAAALAGRLEAAYAREGWPDATVSVAAADEDAFQVDLQVTVTEGAPDRVGRISISTGGALSRGRVRWTLTRSGLVEQQPLRPERRDRAREAIEAKVRGEGWYEAVVTLSTEPTTEGVDLVVFIDPRRFWTIDRAGPHVPSRKEIASTLDLAAGARVTRTFPEDATRTLNQHAYADGYLETALTLTAETAPDAVRLTASGDRGPRHALRKVRFVGVQGESDRVWANRYMQDAFREASADVLSRRRVTPEGIDRALRALQEFYRAQGYLAVHLERGELQSGETTGRVARVDVDVAVTPGPRATLRDVAVVGLAEGVSEGTLFADLVGRPLNPAILEARARRLVETHAEAGYLDADARVRLTVSADGLAGAATVQVTPGPAVYLRSVLLRGYQRTRRSLIERAVDLRPGDALAPSRIAAIRRKIYDVGVFSRVSVEAVGDEDRVKDLVIEVVEKPNLHAEVGGGLATDQGAKVFLRGGHRNLWGLAHRATALGQAGIGWVGDGWSLQWQEPEWRAALRYEAPGVPSQGESLAIDLLINEQAQEPLFRLARTGVGVGVLLRLGTRGRAEVAYKVEQRRLLDVDPGLLVAGEPWLNEVRVSDLDDPRPITPSDPREQSGLAVSVLYDLRDDPFNPTTGGVASLGIDIADRVVGDVSFVRAEGAFAWHVPAGGFGFLFRARGGGGWVLGGDLSLPVEDRFRLGGGASFRGFALDSVGPANEVSPEPIDLPDGLGPIVAWGDRDAPARWVPTGGDAVAVGTLEIKVPFPLLGLDRWEGTDLAFFTDFGNVWYVSELVRTDSMNQRLDPPLRWSVGIGLRRSTAIGPIAIDLGFNPARLEFREETLVRVHVSLGAL